MCEAERERRCAGNERVSRRGGETLEGLQFLPVAVDWSAASGARLVSRDGSRG